MTPIALLLVGGAVYLLWTGITGGSVTGEIKAALTGDPSYQRTPVAVASSSTATGVIKKQEPAPGSRTQVAAGSGFPFDPVAVARSGASKYAIEVTRDALAMFGASWLGIWGDQPHQERKSDHNDGRATDIGVTSVAMGDRIANHFASNTSRYGVRYIIWNRRIWQGGTWSPYTGDSPHTSHVHVSTQ